MWRGLRQAITNHFDREGLIGAQRIERYYDELAAWGWTEGESLTSYTLRFYTELVVRLPDEVGNLPLINHYLDSLPHHMRPAVMFLPR